MSMPRPSSRALMPALLSPTDAPDEPGANSPGSTPAGYVPGIKRASTACQSCKQIKRKCDQAQPCSNCRRSHNPCVYDEAADGRRKAARKRTVESLELKRDALDCILESLRSSDNEHVYQLIDLVRSRAPLEHIVEYVTAHADSLPENQIHSITTIAHESPRKTVLSVSDLCDVPLFRVPSKPWTTITDDSELVSHLVSIYFTWFHPAYPVMDQKLFLHDMSAGSVACQFCNPLLVNTILTIACHFSDHPRSCRIPSDANTRGQHFLDEAIRLWGEQDGRPSLLNIQAGTILAVSLTLVGKDRLSRSYLEQLNVMQQELELKLARADLRATPSISPKVKRSQILASQTLFLLTVGYGGAFMQAPSTAFLRQRELVADPILGPAVKWFPYPQRSPEVTIALDDLHRAYYRLHEIGFDMQKIHFGEQPIMAGKEISLLDERLRSWKNTLPESLLLDLNLSSINPLIMDLYLTYYWFRITLFNFVKTSHPQPVPSLAQIDSGSTQVHSQTIESAQAVAELCKRYSSDFGLKQPTIWMPQTCLSAAYSIIDALTDPEQGPLTQDILHEFCLVLVAASRRWLVMKGHVRMLFVTVEQKRQTLPKRTKDLLKFIALDKWGEMDHLQFASASYPNYALAKVEDPRLATMGDLLEQWANIRGVEGEEAIVENARLSRSRTAR